MTRAKVPQELQDQTLADCRRRCALCYALNNDVSAKLQGQIAHIDRDPNNNKAGNLAYLCLEHASLYDARSQQSKGFTPGELRRYQTALLLVLKVAHDPIHIQRIVAKEYRKLASEAASESRKKKKKPNKKKRKPGEP